MDVTTPSELCLDQDLRLPLDLLCDCSSDSRDTSSKTDYLCELKKKMNLSHKIDKARSR